MPSDARLSPLLALTGDDRANLLRLARAAISAAIAGEPEPPIANPTPPLAQPCGVFVSLHQQHRLRGCIGTLKAEQPLWVAVARMAVASAFDDPRFPPLTQGELTRTDIEISRLTRPRPVTPDHVEAGRHGVCVVNRHRHALLLPQVASLYGWGREQLLAEVCRKALLAPDAWQDPQTILSVFEAEVFGEEAR